MGAKYLAVWDRSDMLAKSVLGGNWGEEMSWKTMK